MNTWCIPKSDAVKMHIWGWWLQWFPRNRLRGTNASTYIYFCFVYLNLKTLCQVLLSDVVIEKLYIYALKEMPMTLIEIEPVSLTPFAISGMETYFLYLTACLNDAHKFSWKAGTDWSSLRTNCNLEWRSMSPEDLSSDYVYIKPDGHLSNSLWNNITFVIFTIRSVWPSMKVTINVINAWCTIMSEAVTIPSMMNII